MRVGGQWTHVAFVQRALSQMDQIVDSVFQYSGFVRLLLQSGDQTAEHLTGAFHSGSPGPLLLIVTAPGVRTGLVPGLLLRPEVAVRVV